jgi:hypothetical protein
MDQSKDLILVIGILCAYLVGLGFVSLVQHTRNRRALLVLLAWLLAALAVIPMAQATGNPGPTAVEIILKATPVLFVIFLAASLVGEMLIQPIARRIAERATRSMPMAPKTKPADNNQPQAPPSADPPGG